MIRNTLLMIIGIFATMGCNTEYSIVGEIGKEYVFIEVPEEGNNEDIWVDSFTQPVGTEGVDILWVIDTSCSMRDEQTLLLDGIDAMMNSLPATGWRLNMISNSPPNVSNEAQFPLVPGDTPDDAKTMFNNISSGVYEMGFDAVEEYIVYNSYASQWMRSDVPLLVVFVSDEEDQSNQTPVSFVNWYSNLRNHVYLASIVHVDPAESLCGVSHFDVGYNSIEATNMLGGVVVDICSDDWAPGVTDASIQIQPYEEYELTQTPTDANEIFVFIDGVPNYDWYYNRTDNTVYFTIIPEGEQLVEIAYPYSPLIIEPSTLPELPFNQGGLFMDESKHPHLKLIKAPETATTPPEPDLHDYVYDPKYSYDLNMPKSELAMLIVAGVLIGTLVGIVAVGLWGGLSLL